MKLEVGGREVDILLASGRDAILGLHPSMAPSDPTALLSGRERRILSGLTVIPRREDWLAGRLVAKALVLQWLGEPDTSPASVEILPDEARVPHAHIDRDGRATRLDVSLSISHRAGAACAAIVSLDRGHVGVDLEVMEPRSEALLEDGFTGTERHLAGQVEDAVAPWGPALVWSLKESALKAAGLGLSVPATDAEVVSIDASGRRARVSIASGSGSSGASRLAEAAYSLHPPLILTAALLAPVPA